MTDIYDPNSAAPSSDERTMATLAHALQLIGSWIAPLVIFLIKRESRFVSFHALQALILQICYTILIVFAMVAWFTLIFSTVLVHAQRSSSPPIAIFAFFPLIWLLFFGSWVLNLVIAIVFSIRAGQGEWAEYPLIGKLARRFLKMGPGGTPLTPH